MLSDNGSCYRSETNGNNASTADGWAFARHDHRLGLVEQKQAADSSQPDPVLASPRTPRGPRSDPRSRTRRAVRLRRACRADHCKGAASAARAVSWKGLRAGPSRSSRRYAVSPVPSSAGVSPAGAELRASETPLRCHLPSDSPFLGAE